MKRIHKGLALHNLGISLFSQGKTEEAIQTFFSAYIEDTIRGKIHFKLNKLQLVIFFARTVFCLCLTTSIAQQTRFC